MKLDHILIFTIILILVGSGAFFGGSKYGENNATKNSANANLTGQQSLEFNGQAGGVTIGSSASGNATRVRNGGGRPITGTVVSANASTLSIKLTDGSTQTVTISSATTLDKTSSASVSDLTSGATVMIVGGQGTDGSTVATSIQINPLNRMFGQGAPIAN